jgi:hypothetical protein
MYVVWKSVDSIITFVDLNRDFQDTEWVYEIAWRKPRLEGLPYMEGWVHFCKAMVI